MIRPARILCCILALLTLASSCGQNVSVQSETSGASSIQEDVLGAASVPDETPGASSVPAAPPTSAPGQNTTLYILMYHDFVPDDQECSDWATTESRFREDLYYLIEHGYQFVVPSDLAAGTPLPEKAVMLTFDDGYASNYRIAYPLLQEYHAKAVIALITKRIIDGKEGFLTWDMCQEMLDSGVVEFGSHTHDVHILADQGVARNPDETQAEYEARVLPDLQTSIDLIQQELGIRPIFFAYPYGRTEPWAEDFIQSHFSVTVTTQAGPADISGGLYELPRYNINARSDFSQILP